MAERRRLIKVITVDDHAVMRQGLSVLLGHVEDVQVVGSASDGRQAVQLAQELRPDVLLMDAVMPGLNGLDATRQVKQSLPDARVIMLSGYVDEDQLIESIRAGVDGYIEKSTGIDEVLRAVRTVIRGTKYFSRSLEEKFNLPDLLLQAQAGERTTGIEALSPTRA